MDFSVTAIPSFLISWIRAANLKHPNLLSAWMAVKGFPVARYFIIMMHCAGRLCLVFFFIYFDCIWLVRFGSRRLFFWFYRESCVGLLAPEVEVKHQVLLAGDLLILL
jgi:hypothetical protein